MQAVSMNTPFDPGVGDSTIHFYQGVLTALDRCGAPFLIGGAYAFNHYTKVNRPTHDLDIFIKREDFERVAAALRDEGYDVELTYPHWLGKIQSGGVFIDLIFSSGNGVAVVDDAWFEHADRAPLLGVQAKISPIEEMIWSKAFIMERERYDGADILHLLFCCADSLDWKRLLQRFGSHWRVLLSHLVLFGFVYPAQRNQVPNWVMEDLLTRLRDEMQTSPEHDTTCQGTLLSREQYLRDLEELGMQDGRVMNGNMTAEDTASWTKAIQQREQ